MLRLNEGHMTKQINPQRSLLRMALGVIMWHAGQLCYYMSVLDEKGFGAYYMDDLKELSRNYIGSLSRLVGSIECYREIKFLKKFSCNFLTMISN